MPQEHTSSELQIPIVDTGPRSLEANRGQVHKVSTTLIRRGQGERSDAPVRILVEGV